MLDSMHIDMNVQSEDIVSTVERLFNGEIPLSYCENSSRVRSSVLMLRISMKIIDESPNFLVITDPNDFALITALYRSSVDGRRYMYEAILSDDGKYNVPDKFTSRTAEILQVYLKSLGVRMETVLDDTNFIGEAEHNTTTAFRFGNRTIFCTVNEMYYLKKMKKVHKRYLKEHPNDIDDADEVWEYIVDNLPFKKKELTPEIIKLFKDNMDVLTDD